MQERRVSISKASFLGKLLPSLIVISIFNENENHLVQLTSFSSSYLKKFSTSLPNIAKSAFAKRTSNKYDLRSDSGYCKRKERIISLPADSFVLVLYLNYLVILKKDRGAKVGSFNKIRWSRLQNGYFSPADNQFINLLFGGAKRTAKSSG